MCIYYSVIIYIMKYQLRFFQNELRLFQNWTILKADEVILKLA